jgi:hypothetical protein
MKATASVRVHEALKALAGSDAGKTILETVTADIVQSLHFTVRVVVAKRFAEYPVLKNYFTKVQRDATGIEKAIWRR